MIAVRGLDYIEYLCLVILPFLHNTLSKDNVVFNIHGSREKAMEFTPVKLS